MNKPHFSNAIFFVLVASGIFLGQCCAPEKFVQYSMQPKMCTVERILIKFWYRWYFIRRAREFIIHAGYWKKVHCSFGLHRKGKNRSVPAACIIKKCAPWAVAASTVQWFFSMLSGKTKPKIKNWCYARAQRSASEQIFMYLWWRQLYFTNCLIVAYATALPSKIQEISLVVNKRKRGEH